MKKYFLGIGCSLLLLNAQAQGIKIMPGTSIVQTGAAAHIVMADNAGFENNAPIIATALMLKATGNGTTDIKGSAPLNVAGLQMSKTTGQVALQKNVSVDGIVDFGGGLLELNANQLLLSSTSILQNESENSRAVSQAGGFIEITQQLNAPLAVNPGNIGLAITSGTNMGTTTIRRSHKAVQQLFGGTGIERSFEVVPANNTALSAQLRAFYFDAEANGLDENKYVFYRSDDGGTNWQSIGASGGDAGQNFVNVSNVNTMAKFTLSTSDNKLAVNSVAASTTEFHLVQNPVQQALQIGVQSAKTLQMIVHVFDVQGKELINTPMATTTGYAQYTTDVSMLAPGSYTVALTGDNSSLWKAQFVKY